MILRIKDIGKRIMHINARRLCRKTNPDLFILLAKEDVTERINMNRELFTRKNIEESGADPFEPLPTGNERVYLVDDEEEIVQLERQMLEKLKRIRPDLPIILCSGYNQYISDKKTKRIGINTVALKPITMIDLSKIIRKVLDRKAIDRRQNERFNIKEKAVAIAKSDPMGKYKIIDISWGGLAIQSCDVAGFHKHFNELAINIVDKGILLDKVPCTIISDSELPDDSNSNLQVSQKRRGIQFGKLAYNQLMVLDHLIQYYTVASGPQTPVEH